MCFTRAAERIVRENERLSQIETEFEPILETPLRVEKKLGEWIGKLAIFVRHPNLLITKVSAGECPSVP